MRKGNVTLRALRASVVWVISHPTDHDLSAKSHRLARRIGKNTAAMAVAHSVLVSIYPVLRTGEPSSDLGADSFQKQAAKRLAQRSLRQLEALGYEVTLTPKVA
jgi:transposase